MNGIAIDRLALRLDGVDPETARAAVEGLEAELLRRLSVRGVDAAALRTLSPSIRLPRIRTGVALDAETLRASIADGLVALLAPASPAEDTEEA
jgi:hypothetical protein